MADYFNLITKNLLTHTDTYIESGLNASHNRLTDVTAKIIITVLVKIDITMN